MSHTIKNQNLESNLLTHESAAKPIHDFYMPVMGTGFSIDSPVKVAHLGVHSVISLVDDTLIERIRQYYCDQLKIPYEAIAKKDDDWRAKRITEYLNLVNKMVNEKFSKLLKESFGDEGDLDKYFNLISERSAIKGLYKEMLSEKDEGKKNSLQNELKSLIAPGRIDVNIMTKLDRDNYRGRTKMGPEYSDAVAALRGFALSDVDGSIILSAGFNRRLLDFCDKFKDFFPNSDGVLKKNIIIKVNDFRSAMIQGKLFARRGLWIDEYRIESGLNCGGHAFASDGALIGPIMEDFKLRREELRESLSAIYLAALEKKGFDVSNLNPEYKVTMQGGVGTHAEQNFLLDHYNVDQVGWGTPFLLVPEATNVEEATLDRLVEAKSSDIFLSGVSPLGVPFYTLVDSPSELAKKEKIKSGKPGSLCPKGHIVQPAKDGEMPICAASRTFQNKGIKTIDAENSDPEAGQALKAQLVNKACICHDLAGGVVIKYGIEGKIGVTPAICPGPNMAFFDKIASFKEMVDHIYGRFNLISRKRSHAFINELKININFLKDKVSLFSEPHSSKDLQFFDKFSGNLMKGIEYYDELAEALFKNTSEMKDTFLKDLSECRELLESRALLQPTTV